MTDSSYSFNNSTELNKIFYDPGLEDLLYREDNKICRIAKACTNGILFNVNQFIYDFVEQTQNNQSSSYRKSLRSNKLYPLTSYGSFDYKMSDVVNSSMIVNRNMWIDSILSAKAKINKKINSQTQ